MKNGWILNHYNTKIHYVNDEIHNDNGPAIIYDYGDKYWYQHDELHREDGPAIEYSNGDKYWWYQDKQTPCFSQEEFKRLIKLLAFL